MRVLQFLSAIISLGLFSSRIIKIARLAQQGLSTSNRAVEGILGAAVAYTLIVMLLTFLLKHGDRLTFVSDGVVEATDSKGELFGFERTQQVSHEQARYIAQIAQRFGQPDDITVVSLYFVPA